LAVELRRRILRRPLGLDFSDEELAEEAADVHFVALDGSRLVGCLVMVPLDTGSVKMRQVAVEPDMRGKGIGARVVVASEDWARDSAYKQIELNARDTAVPFYLRLGYEIEGDLFEEVGIPHLKMRKGLRR
jgi:predicted GNAT family N-acyltransferase